MSGSSGQEAPRRGSFASRKARGEQGSSAPANTKNKSHGYDARFYHQNANTHGIQALRTFDCPVCESKNTIRIDLHPRLSQGTVRCTYCMSLRPVPEDLPYPHVTSYVPSLENKADVFFKFNEKYTALQQQQQQQQAGEVVGPSPSTAVANLRDSSGVSQSMASRKRTRDDGGDGDGSGDGDAEGGLFADLSFYPTDPAALDDVVGDMFNSSTLQEAGIDEHGVCEGEGNKEEALLALAGGGEDGMDDVEIADFFADSD